MKSNGLSIVRFNDAAEELHIFQEVHTQCPLKI